MIYSIYSTTDSWLSSGSSHIDGTSFKDQNFGQDEILELKNKKGQEEIESSRSNKEKRKDDLDKNIFIAKKQYNKYRGILFDFFSNY